MTVTDGAGYDYPYPQPVATVCNGEGSDFCSDLRELGVEISLDARSF